MSPGKVVEREPLTGRLVRTGQDREVAGLGDGCELLGELANGRVSMPRPKLVSELANAIDADTMTKLGGQS
jgi:hypothetical protein